MAASSSDPTPPSRSFSAHLQTLKDFAAELRGQIHALGALRDTNASLAAHELSLGEFAEAGLLRARHDETVAQLRTLVDGIEHAMTFAEDVTYTVSSSYARNDQMVASNLGGAPNPGSTL